MPCQTPVPIVPTEVNEEPVTPVPNADPDRTVVPLISKTLPVNRLKSSDDVHALVALTQLRVLSVAPLRVIPPPSAVISEGTATEPNSIFLSSTVIVVALTVVVVPLTVKLPVTVNALLTVVVPVAAPIERVVAAPAKFTVVAVVLTSAMLCLV